MRQPGGHRSPRHPPAFFVVSVAAVVLVCLHVCFLCALSLLPSALVRVRWGGPGPQWKLHGHVRVPFCCLCTRASEESLASGQRALEKNAIACPSRQDTMVVKLAVHAATLPAFRLLKKPHALRKGFAEAVHAQPPINFVSARPPAWQGPRNAKRRPRYPWPNVSCTLYRL